MTQPSNPKAIFLAAVEESNLERRAKLIDEACASNVALRARVEELLAAHKPDLFFERPAVPIDATIEHDSSNAEMSDYQTLPPMEANDNSSNRGDVGDRVRYFGDYELLEEIARGGMGVVYKARQTSLGRIVALKMILAGQLASKSDIRRFYLEARAAANLDHPGIVPIYEIGEHDRAHFFTMAFVDGNSLSNKLNDGPISPKLAVAYVGKIADAIQFAHDHGVIHRDLKPANILLDNCGNPKVTDFGLVKQIESTDALTMTGQIVGTPSFMPPEQAAGKHHELGPAADIYSLGALLYALLTGFPPFQGKNALDILMQVIDRPAIPLRQINAKLPRDLETICSKCLQKEPEKRYVSAAELAEDLRRFEKGEPIRARPISPIERVQQWYRRHPIIANAMLAFFGGISLTWLLQVVPTAESSTLTQQGQSFDAMGALNDPFPKKRNTAPAVRIGQSSSVESNFLGEVLYYMNTSYPSYPLAFNRSNIETTIWACPSNPTDALTALEKGEVDVYPMYTSEIAAGLGVRMSELDEGELEAILNERGLRKTEPLGAPRTCGLVVRSVTAEKLGLAKISDLAAAKNSEVRLGFSRDFMNSLDHWPSLAEALQLTQKPKIIERTVATPWSDKPSIDVTDIFSTEFMRLPEYYVALEDDVGLFASDDCVFVYSKALESRADFDSRLLSILEGKVDESTLQSVHCNPLNRKRLSIDFLARRLRITNRHYHRGYAPPQEPSLRAATREHLFLVAVPIGIALIITLPMIGLLTRIRWLTNPVFNASRAVLAVPFVAMLVLQVGLFGYGAAPALFSLTAFSIAMIMRQTTTYLASPTMRLSSLANELISGLKNASFYCVGNGMVAGIVGAGGYGAIILGAIRTNDLNWMIQASVLATLLALFLFGVFGLVEQLLRSRTLFKQVTQTK
ncbi:MAG: protein kinase [Pirellula sp.]